MAQSCHAEITYMLRKKKRLVKATGIFHYLLRLRAFPLTVNHKTMKTVIQNTG